MIELNLINPGFCKKEDLKEQAKYTCQQIVEMFDNAEFNSSTGTKIPSFERIIEELREVSRK